MCQLNDIPSRDDKSSFSSAGAFALVQLCSLQVVVFWSRCAPVGKTLARLMMSCVFWAWPREAQSEYSEVLPKCPSKDVGHTCSNTCSQAVFFFQRFPPSVLCMENGGAGLPSEVEEGGFWSTALVSFFVYSIFSACDIGAAHLCLFHCAFQVITSREDGLGRYCGF